MKNSNFKILYNIKLDHPHYNDGYCRALKIRPTISCIELLNGYGLRFKPYKGGAVIFGESMKENSGVWQLKNPFTNTVPLKFAFIIEKEEDFSLFEKVAYLDDFVFDNNDLGISGKQIYYFDNLNNSTAEIRRASTIELSDDDTSVSKGDRVWMISEMLKLKPSLSGQASIKFKKVFDAPNSDRQLGTFLLVENKSNGISMTELYRKLINQGVIIENEKQFPIIPSGFYNIETGGIISKIYTDENINIQNVWGIIELFENRDATSSKVDFKVSFEEKNDESRFNDMDKGTGGYPKSECYNYFITHDGTYKESVKYPDF